MASPFRRRFGTNFFEVDITDTSGRVIQRVGTAKMRVIRRQANTVKVAAKRSMKRGRRYASEAAMPPHVALTYRIRRQAWHVKGEDPSYEPKVSQYRIPSAPNTPPHTGLRPLLRKMLFAQKSGTKKHGGSFITGPVLLPRGKASNLTTPETHQYSGTKKNPASIHGQARWARYPKRPYMIPALKRVAPTFAAMWKDQV
jgi:hypothetical protein